MIVLITSCAPVLAFSQPGIKPQIAASHGAGQESQRHVDEDRQAGHEIAHKGGKDGADENLAFGADVEQAGAETKRHRQTAKNIGSGSHQAFEEGVKRLADCYRVPALKRSHDLLRIAEGAGEERRVGGHQDIPGFFEARNRRN